MRQLLTLILVSITSIALAQNSTIDDLISDGKLIKALELVDHLNPGADQFGYWGVIARQKGQYEKAVDYFNKEIDALGNSDDSLRMAQTYSNIGVTEWAMGNHSQSLQFHFRALGIRSHANNNSEIAASYNDIGLVYSQQDPDKALEYYEMALAIYKEIYDATDEHVATALINIGITYKNMALYGDAVVNLEEAAEIREANQGKDHATVAFVKSSLGNVYFEMNDLKSALEYQQQALDIYLNFYGDKHPEIANTYNFMGNIKSQDKDYEAAIVYYQKAIIANMVNYSATDSYAIPPLTNYYNADILLFSILQKAQSLESHYYTKTLKYKDLRATYDHLVVCDSLIDKIRKLKSNEADKIALGKIANEVYEDGIRICLALAELNKNKQMFLNMAFYFAEKSKSAVLLDAIAETNAKSFANIPSEMLAQEEAIKSDIAYYQQKLAQKPDPDSEKEYRSQLFNLNKQYTAFTKELETNYSDYYDLKYNTNIPSVQDLQAMMDEQTALVSYFIAEKTSRLYAFIITKDKYKIHNVKTEADLNRSLLGFRNAVYFKVQATYATTAHSLYKLLMPKSIGKGITQLVIIPTGRLGTIPFEALLTEEVDLESPYNTLPYLIKKYSINMQYAATLYEQSMKKEKKVMNDNICLVAPVDFTAYGLPMLPGTASEVDAISNIFSNDNRMASTYINGEANEGVVKLDNLTNSKYIHFATHGVVDETNPELSQLFLSPSNNEDGNLYSGEIYNLSLNADLVTLSACQTGLGKISKGEGVIGLSRALVYSGANNLIVSLWSVADQSTSELMVDFYSGIIKDNKNYSDALQSAKVQMISSTNYSAPYYWAPFILIGK